LAGVTQLVDCPPAEAAEHLGLHRISEARLEALRLHGKELLRLPDPSAQPREGVPSPEQQRADLELHQTQFLGQFTTQRRLRRLTRLQASTWRHPERRPAGLAQFLQQHLDGGRYHYRPHRLTLMD